MKVVNLKEEAYDIPKDGYDLIVTNYETGDYCGGGYAYLLSNDGEYVLEWDLGHCSCYGPFTTGSPSKPMQLNTFIDMVNGEQVNVGGVADLETAKRFLEERAILLADRLMEIDWRAGIG